MFNFDQPSFQDVSSLEWIVTNGIGGYASSTVCGANTRRYHGLLVASFHPPSDRRVVLSKLEEEIVGDGETLLLGSNAYPGVIHPQGYQWLKSFSRTPFPNMVFQKNDLVLSKTIFMRYGSNTTVVAYENKGEKKFQLRLNPLLVYRDYHHLFHESPIWNFEVVEEEKTLEVHARSGQPAIWIRFTRGRFHSHPDWYRNFQYEKEKERGLDHTEDAKSIGWIDSTLAPGEVLYILLSTTKEDVQGNPAAWKRREEKRLQNIQLDTTNSFLSDLAKSGNQFLVQRPASGGYTIIAGYHWFTDWGRDTMIAMRGLVIACGQKRVAESIFDTFLSWLDAGMIPNRFPDQGEQPEYNTLDATLWLFVALHDYFEKFQDTRYIKKVFPKLSEILTFHIEGTRFNIYETEQGLLFGGEEGVQLTWMDAKVNGHVVTPRMGCAVEINALWYNALCIYEAFAGLIGEEIPWIRKKIRKTGKSFCKYFLHKKGFLYDGVGPDGKKDASIRPNQIYAVSLPFSPLNQKESKKILANVEKHLYTPFGLRSLSPRHKDFKPVYTGDPWTRDHAYHQGTVWSHLWGEYAIAYLKVHRYSNAAKQYIRIQSGTLEEHFYHRNGIHCMSEIFDGEHPGEGKGCIQQAWSVGMTILALLKAE
jgi:predicted glycogen debranching enzyme